MKLILSLLLVINLLYAVNLTKKEQNFIKNNPEIILGVDSSWSPLVILNSDKEITGLNSDILKLINKATGANFVQKLGNWKKLQEDAKNKKIHGLNSLTHTKKREKFLNFTSTVFKLNFGLYTSFEKLKLIKNEEDLKNLRFAREKANAVHDAITKKYDITKLVFSNTSLESYKKIFNDEADVVTAYNGFQFKLSKHGLPLLFNTNTFNKEIDIKMAIRKDLPEALSILQKGLDTIPKDKIEQLLIKWQMNTKTETSESYSNLALNEEEKKYLKNNPILNLGYSLDFEPLFMESSKNSYEGIVVDNYKLIANRLGVKIKYTIGEWNNIINKTANGEIDVIPMMSPKTAKRNNILVTNSFFDIRILVYTKKDKQLYINSIEDLKGLTISYNKNIIILDKFLKKYDGEIKLLPLSNNDDIFRLLNDDKVDAAIAFNTSQYTLTKQFLTDIVPIHTLKKPIIGAVTAINPQKPILQSILSKAINSISSFEKQKISEKWLSKNVISKKFLLSKTEKEYLKNNTFNICEQYDIYPLSGIKNGKVIGMRGEVINEIVKKINLKLKTLPVTSRKILIEKVNNKECHMIGSLGSGQKAFPTIINTNTVMEFPYAMIGDLNSFNMGPYSDLSKLKIIVRFENIKNRILSAYPNLNIEVINDIDTAISKVGGNTHFIGLRPVTERIIQKYGFEKYKLNGVLDRINQKSTMGVHEDYPMLLSIINKTVATIDKEELNQIKEKYAIKEFKVIKTTNPIPLYFLGVLIFVSILTYYRYILLKRKNIEIEKKNIELRKKDQLLFQQSKMAAMGEMIGAIAHQWRQPINEISISIQNLEYNYEDKVINKEFIDKFIEKNQKILNFMSNTIDNFRNFFRVDKDKTNFDVKEEIEFVFSLLSAQFKNHNINLYLSGETFEVNGYKNEFQQAIMNIINNAKDIIIQREIKNGLVTVKLSNKKIEIIDNAGGIEKSIINRIFEPYFTTKEQGKGTGIGLYLANSVIENINGKLSAENANEGAKFIIDLTNMDKSND